VTTAVFWLTLATTAAWLGCGWHRAATRHDDALATVGAQVDAEPDRPYDQDRAAS